MKKLLNLFKTDNSVKRDTFITKQVKFYTTNPPQPVDYHTWCKEFRVSSLHGVQIVHM